jgi:cation-dependent mannose-6-phosphate receptor
VPYASARSLDLLLYGLSSVTRLPCVFVLIGGCLPWTFEFSSFVTSKILDGQRLIALEPREQPHQSLSRVDSRSQVSNVHLQSYLLASLSAPWHSDRILTPNLCSPVNCSKMYLSTSLLFLLSLRLPSILAAADSKGPPCTIHSSSTGSFFDLRPLQLTLDGTKYQSASNESYRSRGYDYPGNFTLNFCGPVVEDLDDVEGISTSRQRNVSAFYKDQRGDIYSIGQQNDQLLFRGKKLILNYTQGSPCPDLDSEGNPVDIVSLHGDASAAAKASKRRKSTLFTFACDTSPLLSGRPAVNFLGSPDHCTYVFEVRSRYACGGTTQSEEKGTLGPGAVFGLIAGIAMLVYLIGGIVYQRNVLHQRGWRQLPNYAMWAGIFSFFSVSILTFFSSRLRFVCPYIRCKQQRPFLSTPHQLRYSPVKRYPDRKFDYP